MTEIDPCPYCGKNRKLVGYRHHCTPDAAKPTPSQVEISAFTEQVDKATKAVLKRAPKRRPPSPAVAAVVAQIEEKKSAKAGRDGKKQIAVWVDEQTVKGLKHAAIEAEITVERAVDLAIKLWLEAR